nr:hypothetical protein [Buchananella hordeovulneris]
MKLTPGPVVKAMVAAAAQAGMSVVLSIGANLEFGARAKRKLFAEGEGKLHRVRSLPVISAEPVSSVGLYRHNSAVLIHECHAERIAHTERVTSGTFLDPEVRGRIRGTQ